jgi:hypothetical protein
MMINSSTLLESGFGWSVKLADAARGDWLASILELPSISTRCSARLPGSPDSSPPGVLESADRSSIAAFVEMQTAEDRRVPGVATRDDVDRITLRAAPRNHV